MSPVAPELCKFQSAPPTGDGWLVETKFDGYRLLTSVVDRKVRLWSRNGVEWTGRLPEVVAAIQSLGKKSLQLDGELIAVRAGRDEFSALRRTAFRPRRRQPLQYMVFDIPFLNGRSLRELPLIKRKAILNDLLSRNPHPLLRYTEHHAGDAAKLFAAAVAHGFEGIVCKRVNSPYRDGARNGDWIKVKAKAFDTFVVVGYIAAQVKSRTAYLTAALRYDGKLVCVGLVPVSSGLVKALAKTPHVLARPAPSLDLRLVEEKKLRGIVWLKPHIKIDVYHRGLDESGMLRRPTLKAVLTGL